jgi:hypothetical protein
MFLAPAIAMGQPSGGAIFGIEQACETICRTREFWQIRRQNEFVFNRQARPSPYLFPISLVLHMSQTAMCNPRIHSGKWQSSPKQERSVLLGLKATAVGTCLRRSAVDQLRVAQEPW